MVGTRGKKRRMKVGVQLYTLRDALATDLAGGLAKVKSLGYNWVELAGLYDLSARELGTLLSDTGLTAASAHYGLTQLEDDFGQVVEDLNTLGLTNVVMPWISADSYEGRWEEIASRLNGVGSALADEGVRLSYHNHDFELRDDQGVVPFEFLADHLDPASVGFQIDVAWVHHAGHNPAEWIERLGDQVDFLHLKDVTASGELCDVGSGAVDWDAVLAAAAEQGIETGFVEHDNPQDAFATIANCRAFLVGRNVEF